MIRLSISASGDPAGVIGDARQRLAKGFGAMVEALGKSAQQTAPVRTGALRDSVSVAYGGPLTGKVAYGAPYASFLHEGTGIYGPRGQMIIIRPKNKKALFWPGASHPVGVVRQKGIRPQGFVQRAIREAGLARAFDDAFNGEGGENG